MTHRSANTLMISLYWLCSPAFSILTLTDQITMRYVYHHCTSKNTVAWEYPLHISYYPFLGITSGTVFHDVQCVSTTRPKILEHETVLYSAARIFSAISVTLSDYYLVTKCWNWIILYIITRNNYLSTSISLM